MPSPIAPETNPGAPTVNIRSGSAGPPVAMNLCRVCIFYRAIAAPPTGAFGNCHRYPPQAATARVEADWWCGEFKRLSGP